MAAVGRGETERVCREHRKQAAWRGDADGVSLAKEMAGHACSEHAMLYHAVSKISGWAQVVRVADAHNSHAGRPRLIDCQTHGVAGGHQAQSRASVEASRVRCFVFHSNFRLWPQQSL